MGEDRAGDSVDVEAEVDATEEVLAGGLPRRSASSSANVTRKRTSSSSNQAQQVHPPRIPSALSSLQYPASHPRQLSARIQLAEVSPSSQSDHSPLSLVHWILFGLILALCRCQVVEW